MLKEKLYAEYLAMHDAYRRKHKKIDELQDQIFALKNEQRATSNKIKEEKQDAINRLLQDQSTCQNRLFKVQNESKSSEVLRSVDETKYNMMCGLHSHIEALEQEKKDKRKAIQDNRKNEKKHLEANITACEKNLRALEGNQIIKKQVDFNEDELRKKLEATKKTLLNERDNAFKSSIKKIKDDLDSLDARYQAELDKAKAEIEEDAYLKDLHTSISEMRDNNTLPNLIDEGLQEPVGLIIERKGFETTNAVINCARRAKPIDELSSFAPSWLIPCITFGLPVLAGIIPLLIFIFTGISLPFVASATNAVANFLFHLLVTVVVAAVVYGIVGALFQRKVLGGFLSVASIAICFFTVWERSIHLPYAVLNVTEWIVKIIICLLVAVGVFFLLTGPSLDIKLAKLLMKFGPLKRKASAARDEAVAEHKDSYVVLLQYDMVLTLTVNAQKAKEKDRLTQELATQESIQEAEMKKFTDEQSSLVESQMNKSKREAEQKRSELAAQKQALMADQDACMEELSRYQTALVSFNDETQRLLAENDATYAESIQRDKQRIKEIEKELSLNMNDLAVQLSEELAAYEQRMADLDAQYESTHLAAMNVVDAKIKEIQDAIAQYESEFKDDVDAMDQLLKTITGDTVKPEEARGVLSNYLYLANKQEGTEPVVLQQIKHDKKPIVFLYDNDDNLDDVSSFIYDFVKSTVMGLYTINPMTIMDVVIMELVTHGRKFAKMNSGIDLVRISDDIKSLSDEIQQSMNDIARQGKSLDALNIDKFEKEGRNANEKYTKYKIVSFVVPREADAVNTNFLTSSLWGALVDGKENGFVPIFYISYQDWRDTFDDENKLNSQFIKQLKHTIGNSNGLVYKIDTKNISIKEVRN